MRYVYRILTENPRETKTAPGAVTRIQIKYFRESGSLDMDLINWFGGSDGKLILTFFFSPGATTPIGDCILQPCSGL